MAAARAAAQQLDDAQAQAAVRHGQHVRISCNDQCETPLRFWLGVFSGKPKLH